MASPRTLTARVLLLVALAVPAAGAAGCGEDADPASARVGSGSAGAADDAGAGGGARDAGEEAAGEAAGDAEDLVPGAVDEPDAGSAPQPAGGGIAPGDPPYEGDGDGDSSDDAPAAGAPAAVAPGGSPRSDGDGDGGAGGATAPSGGTGGAAGGAEAAAGDEDPVAVPASFVLEDGGASPMRAEVAAFLGIALEVENAEARAVQVRLRAPGAETFTVGAGETVSRTVAGLPPGLYPLEVDGGASGAVVIVEG